MGTSDEIEMIAIDETIAGELKRFATDYWIDILIITAKKCSQEV